MNIFHPRRHLALQKELKRKLIHLLQVPGVMFYVYLLHTYSQRVALLVAVGIFVVLVKLEYLRIEYGVPVPKVFRFLMRKREEKNFSGIIYFTISIIICFAIFDYTIAIVSLLFVAFGDFSSALFGIAFGKKKLRKNKTYVGFVAGLVANFMVAAFFLINQPILLIPMVLTGSLVELTTHKLDDNLTIPVLSGFVGQMIAIIFGIST